MGNPNRNLWIGLIVIVALGLLIETMKSSDHAGRSIKARMGAFGIALEDENSPELEDRREAAQRARDRMRSRLSGRVAGLTNSKLIAQQAATEEVAPAATPSGPANLGAPNAINTEEAKKAAAKKAAEDAKKKKKKKKKKKTEVAGEQPAVTTSVTEADEKDDSSNDVGGGSSSTSGQVRTAINAAQQPTKEIESPESVDEWVAFLLQEPSYEKTMKFVETHQRREIDSLLFHEVIAEMIGDSRENVHEFAILALGSAPSLKSFLTLQSLNQSLAESSPLKIQSRNHLKSYSKIENLRYLANVISAPTDSAIVSEAMQLVRVAVGNYSPSQNAPPGGGPSTSTPHPGPTPANVIRQFNPLVSVLNRLATTTTDAALRQEASRTLVQVQTIVGST